MKKEFYALALSLNCLFTTKVPYDFVIKRIHEQENELDIKYSSTPNIVNGPFPLLQFLEKAEIPIDDRMIYYASYTRSGYCPLNDTIYLTEARVLDHELGHHFTNDVSRDIGLGNFPVTEACLYTTDGHRIIFEGIASYVQFRMTGSTSDKHHQYDDGFNVVKPVLDIDIRKGIEYFLRNIPTGEDIENLNAYTAKALVDVKRTVIK